MSALMPTYARQPLAFARGEGARLYDEQGKVWLDAVSGLAVTALGHAHPAISRAISRQAETLLHTSNLYRIPAQEALAERLCRIAAMDAVFFCNSGTEANEAAIKLARLHAHARGIATPQIVVMENAFHGRTLGALAATGNERIKQGFAPDLPGFIRVPFDDIEAIRALGERDDIAAVLLEPAQGEGGVRIPAKGYLAAVRALCDQHHWLMMLDEVQLGMGRSGRWFAHQHEHIVPDAMSLAKALGNGVPIGALVTRGAAAELMQPGSHGSTFGGNPLACTVGAAVIDTIEADRLLERADSLGRRIVRELNERLHNLPGVSEVRGLGLFIGIELDRPCSELVAMAAARGLLINVTAGNVVRLLPPYVMSDADTAELLERLSALLHEFLTGKPNSEAGTS